MKVNEEKTQLVCISASKSAEVNSYINANKSRLLSGNELKILGFWFSTEPTVELQVKKMESKFRSRLWALRHLKRSRMKSADLLFIYKSVVRSVLDFACPTYHTMLSVTQSERLERLQRRAMKCIYGVERSYENILSTEDIERLDLRRENLFTNFAIKASNNERVKHKWFPPSHKHDHDTRVNKPFKEFPARTERLYNSPMFQMRKRLNRERDT